VIQDLREKKVRVDSIKTKKLNPVGAAKKAEAPKRPLINSVFNLAKQG
jgi:Rrf2 family iron-sulfur cluster assembly transcriptional regulator